MRQGFFSLETVPSARPVGLQPACGKCGLHLSCRSPKMPVAGTGRLGILVVGEAPGCITGDSLVETAYRDKSKHPKGVPIKDLVGHSGFYVYSYDVERQKLALGNVKKVWKTGRKKVYRVWYEWHQFTNNGIPRNRRGWLDVTSNHKFLLKRPSKKDPFKGKNAGELYLSIDQGLSVGHSIQPFYRHPLKHQKVGTSYKDIVLEGRYLLEQKLGRVLTDKEHCHHENENKWDDSWHNLFCLSAADHTTHHMTKNNPMSREECRKAHKKAMSQESYRTGQSKKLKKYLSDPGNYAARVIQIRKQSGRVSATMKNKYRTDPDFYWNYLVNRMRHFGLNEEWAAKKFQERFPDQTPPEGNHKIVKIEYLGYRDVFDMEVKDYHNFAVNGIFVHNSQEDVIGRPFVGPAGQVLQTELRRNEVDLFADCWVTNAAACRPPRNELPDKAIDHCRPLVARAIRELKPKVILLLGGSAVVSVIRLAGWKNDLSRKNTGRWVGWRIPHRRWNAWICPTYHPSYLLHERGRTREGSGNPVLERTFAHHVRAAVRLAKSRPWPDGVPEEDVSVVMDPEMGADMLRVYGRKKLLAFDYETTCLKPDGPNAEIVSCSVSDGGTAIAYPWVGEAIKATTDILRNPDVGKIAANLKFEDRWTRAKLGFRVRNWAWDTMIAAHALDSRGGITGLKFQAFVKLGVEDYDSHVHPFLTADGGNARNRIRQLDLPSLLRYNALDSLYEYRLAQIQMKEMGEAGLYV